MKEPILKALRDSGQAVQDFGTHRLDHRGDYPGSIIRLARAVAQGKVERGIAIWGGSVVASFAANRVTGVRSALTRESFSAHQGVEDDHMNLHCLGGRVVGFALAWEIDQTYLPAHYSRAERFERRLAKIVAIECKE